MSEYSGSGHGSRDHMKNRDMQRLKETEHGGFKCSHCREWAPINEFIGTENRNHCPGCLWSKHLDDLKPGDRKSNCRGGMEPIGLTFKRVGSDKWGKDREGELMLIHECSQCDKISINRIAADDTIPKILDLLDNDSRLEPEENLRLKEANITLLHEQNREQVNSQLFGRINLNKAE